MNTNPYGTVHTHRRYTNTVDTTKYPNTPQVSTTLPTTTLPTTTTTSADKTRTNVGSLRQLCAQFDIQHDATLADTSTKTLLHTLHTLTASRATEHRLTHRLGQLQRSRELGVLQSADDVEERLNKLRRLHQAIKLVLQHPEQYVDRLQKATGQAMAVSLEYQQQVQHVFLLLEQLHGTLGDDAEMIQLIRWAQDTRNKTVDNVKKQLSCLSLLVESLLDKQDETTQERIRRETNFEDP